MRRFLAVALVASALIFVAPPAGACTCTPFDTRQALAESPAAFIGTVLERQEPPADPDGEPVPDALATYRFRVDQAIKGNLGDEVTVRSPGDASACGINAPAERSVALLLSEQDGEWFASLCRQPSPERLLRAAQPLPGPDGSLPPDLLIASTYGVGRSVALDFDGRVAATGGGAGMPVTVAACPGKQRAIEVFTVRHLDGSLSPGVAVRRVTTMELEAEHVLAHHRDVPEAGACRDAAGRDLVLFTRDADGEDPQGRILQVVDGASRLLWEGPAPKAVAFDAAGRTAYLNLGVDGEDLVGVDLAPPAGQTVRIFPIAKVPAGSGPMSPSPDGRWLATVADAHHRASQAVVVDTRSSPAAVTAANLSGAGIMGEMVWATPERVLFTPRLRPAEPVRAYDPALNLVTSWTGWIAEHSTVANGRLYGVNQGAVRSAALTNGPGELIRDLEDALVFAVVDVSVPPARDDRGAVAGTATTTTTAPATPPPTQPAEAPVTTTTTTAPPVTATTIPAAPETAAPAATQPPAPGQATPVAQSEEAGDNRGGVAGVVVAALGGLAVAGGSMAWRRWGRRPVSPG